MRSRSLVVLVLLVVVVSSFLGQGTPQSRGLRLKCDGVIPGYTLFAPMSSGMTYLIDVNGQVVRTWKSSLLPSAWVVFLDNGHILRGGSDRGFSPFGGGGQGGRFQEFDFDGNLVWDFRYNTPRLPHHDVAVLPNGNILAIAWEGKTAEETHGVGRRSSAIPANGIWPDMLIEFEPKPPNDARIVWEWHLWDHLVQNMDPTLENFADPASRPERININGDSGGPGFSRDVFHTNAVDYNPELDQILLSVPTFNEVWVIDHSTTTQEAAGRTGGRYGKGGDLLYRWGNPQVYGRGTADDQLLGFQHDARWIPQGRPGAGHMTVFSNQTPTPIGGFTKVYEFVPPVDAEGRYSIPALGPFGPAAPLWTYSNPSFQATNLSGAERLENGNTLVSEGPEGRVFEVTPAGEIVWEYWSPYSGISGNSGNAFSLFRATRIRPDHPGLIGRDLRPLDPQPPKSPSASQGTLPGAGPCPAAAVPAPTLTSIQPSTGVQGTTVDVVLTGTHFVSPSVAVSGEGIAVGEVSVTSEKSLTVKLTIGSDAIAGIRNLVVTTPGGEATAVFTVLPPRPTLTGITPGIGARGASGVLEVTLTGTNFVPGLTLDAGPAIVVIKVDVASSREATAQLHIATDAPLGPLDVTISTGAGTSNPISFTVADPFPDLSIRSTHTGSFGAGFDETYDVTVRNVGAAPAAGTITVTDLLPAGLTFVSGSGTGWSCSAAGASVTCANSSDLLPNASTGYQIKVSVSGSVATHADHTVSVFVDGDLNAANNTSSDATTVVMPSPGFVFSPLTPGQQATMAITMATPFPHDVNGSVELTFSSNAVVPVDDPAIQLATGGRSATFTIPANKTEALFGSALLSGPLAFQSGTVAGTLKFAGTFTAGTISGQVAPVSSADTLTIPLRALSIQSIKTSTEGGFAVSILLLSAAREVTQLSLSFNTNPKVVLSCGATPGCSASGNTLTLDVSPLFSQWFNGDVNFGGLAQLRLPFSIEGGSVRGSVAVALRNTKGESNSQSFALP